MIPVLSETLINARVIFFTTILRYFLPHLS